MICGAAPLLHRHRTGRVSTAIVAAGVLVWTFSLGCEGALPLDGTQTAASAASPQEQVANQGPTGAVATVDGAEATASITDSTIALFSEASSATTDAVASGSREVCYGNAGETPVQAQASVSITDGRIERFCSASGGLASVVVSLDAQRNQEAPIPVYSGTASIDCVSPSLTGTLQFAETIGGFRWVSSQAPLFFPDIVELQPGDHVRLTLHVTAEAHAGDEAAPYLRASLSATHGGAGPVVQVPCSTPPACPGPCDSGELCIDGECRVPVFAPLAVSVTTTPVLLPGQAFSPIIQVGGKAGDLLAAEIGITIPPGAATRNGAPFPGQIVGNCTDPIARNIVAASADDFFLDITANGVADPTDAAGTITAQPGGGYHIGITLPPPISGPTLPTDVTASCTLFTMFVAGTPGSYPIAVAATSTLAIIPAATYATEVALVVHGTPAATATATQTGVAPTASPTSTPTLPPAPTATPTDTAQPAITDTPTVGPSATATPTSTGAVPADAVVLPVKPVTVIVKAGAASAVKRIKVKVRNAASGTHTIDLMASSDCPGATGIAVDFDAKTSGNQTAVLLGAGKSKAAVVDLSVSADDFVTFNKKAPRRCSVTFTVAAQSGSETTPDNNTARLEVNVIDRNDPPQSSVHESLIKSIKPATIKIPKGQTAGAKTVRPAVVNADILPAVEKPGDTLVVTAGDGTCPPGSIGIVDFDRPTAGAQNTATVKGGAARTGLVPLHIDGALIRATPNAKSPARCAATLTTG